MSLNYIRNYYAVPAKRRGKVTYKGQLGTITGASGPHVRMRLDGEKRIRSYHPMDLIYLPKQTSDAANPEKA